MRKLVVALAISTAGAVPAALAVTGTAFASGTNQYGSGFPVSSSGYCHGAFANTNGNFGIRGQVSLLDGVAGGVPVVGSAGYDNSALSGDCTLPSGN